MLMPKAPRGSFGRESLRECGDREDKERCAVRGERRMDGVATRSEYQIRILETDVPWIAITVTTDSAACWLQGETDGVHSVFIELRDSSRDRMYMCWRVQDSASSVMQLQKFFEADSEWRGQLTTRGYGGGKGGYVALVTVHCVEFIKPTQALEAPHGSEMVS